MRVVRLLSALMLVGCPQAGRSIAAHVVISGNGVVSAGTQSCEGDCQFMVPRGTEFSAQPAPGWTFDGWGGDCEGAPSRCTAANPGAFEARFAESGKTLSIEVVGSGRVTLSSGENCTGLCSFSNRTQTVSIQAMPDRGWEFAGFEADCSGTACTLISGRVVARFVALPVLNIDITGTGGGVVRDSFGRFECRTSCSIPVSGEVPIDLLFDANTIRARLSGACTALPCRVSAPARLSVEFVRGRRVQVSLSGPGTISGSFGLSCPASCSTLVDPTAELELRSTSRGTFSKFNGWDGGCTEVDGGICHINAATADVDVHGAFASDLLGLQTFKMTQSEAAGILVRRSASTIYWAWVGAYGIVVNGREYGPERPALRSTLFAKMFDDGGVQWVASYASTLDAGVVHIVPEYLRLRGDNLVTGGRCVTMTGFCQNPNFILEFSPDGGVVYAGSLNGPMLPYADLGSLAAVAQEEQLLSYPTGAATAITQTLAPAKMGTCEPGTETPLCLISWAIGGSWQGCSLAQPIGPVQGRNAALVRWDPGAGTCSMQASFQTTTDQNSRLRPIVVGNGLIALYAQEAVLDSRTMTSGRTLAVGQIVDGGFSWQTSIFPSVDTAFVDSRGISIGFIQASAFGVSIPFGGVGLLSFGPGPSLRRSLVFERVSRIHGHSDNGITTLAVMGENVTLEGEALAPPDAGTFVHFLTFPD